MASVAGQRSTCPVGAVSAWLGPVRDDGSDLCPVERVQSAPGEGGHVLGWCQVHCDAVDAGLRSDDPPRFPDTSRRGHGVEAGRDRTTGERVCAQLAGRSLLDCRAHVDDAATGDAAVLAVLTTAEIDTLEAVDQVGTGAGVERSEERRVGKECRTRRTAHDVNKRKKSTDKNE